MVQREGDRFGMLETIRDFAREQLLASGDVDAMAERDAVFFEALAERIYARRLHDDKEGLDELATAGIGQPARALRLAGAAAVEFEAHAVDLSGIVFWMALLARYLGSERSAPSADGARAAWEDGMRPGFELAIALAAETEKPTSA